ncbi:MAG: YcxB family protein [Lachnospiraceae bacterium]|nr:YcxB family protein [Lachnospiraceae bacterium]
MEPNESNNQAEPEFEHEEGEVRLCGPLRFRDLFAFRVKYAYFSLNLNSLGYWIVTLLIAGLLIGFWGSYEIKTKVILFVLLGILVIYQPLNAALRTLQYTTMLKAEGIESEYVINRNGILVRQGAGRDAIKDDQGDRSEVITWEMIRKVKETGKRFYLYVMKNSAFVFGKDLLGDQTEALRGFIKGAGKM